MSFSSAEPKVVTVPRLELKNVGKRYPGVIANDDISLRVMPGEIHAILGENGAGKSTLMKIIYGATKADSGEIYWNGNLVQSHNPALSRSLGIEMVYQHFVLFESVSVVENIAMSVAGSFDLDALAARVVDLSERYGIPVEPRRLVHDLSVGERQRVEIVRCLIQNPKLLILDEPTSVLTPQAVERLFETLRLLAAEGCSILYISHKLNEVRELCSNATILRNGRVTGAVDPRTTSSAELTRLMVGAQLPNMQLAPSERTPDPLLKIRNLSAEPVDLYGMPLSDISLDVHGGEVVGIAGVSGNGQAELLSLLSGERVLNKDDAIQIGDIFCAGLDAGQRRVCGLAYVPEQRLGKGAVSTHRLIENGLLTGHAHGLVKSGLVDLKRASSFARQICSRFNVKSNGITATAHSLSGGNLQKFIVGREIELRPKVLIVAQPTWGVDVGAAAFIRQTLIDLSRSGSAVLVVSEELDEIFEICDRIAVMSGGRLSHALERERTNRNEIGHLMSGHSE